MAVTTAFEDAPLLPFHWRLALGATGGAFCDGFALGVVSTALPLAGSQLAMSPQMSGLVGAGSLFGLFLGALATGWLADRFGRRALYASNMGVLAAVSCLQGWVGSAAQLLCLRVAIGLLLGTDYVVSKAMLAEHSPRRLRSRFLSLLSVAWPVGYAAAYAVGYWLLGTGDEAWRWILLSSAVPALFFLPWRVGIPESPQWLVARGRLAAARDIVRRYLGPGIEAPHAAPGPATRARWRQLFARDLWRSTLVGSTFFTCLVIPYFALGTFMPGVMTAMNIRNNYFGSLIYNALLLVGAIAGTLVVNRVSRRSYLFWAFTAPAIALLVLILRTHLSAGGIIVWFAVFAGTLSAAQCMVYVYLPELFPVALRASGIGLSIASSRIGAAVSTFLLPVIVAGAGARTALAGCVLVLAVGCVICLWLAPETRDNPVSPGVAS